MSESQDKDPAAEPPPQPVDPRLLEILVCPLTKQPLIYDRVRNELISRAPASLTPSGAASHHAPG